MNLSSLTLLIWYVVSYGQKTTDWPDALKNGTPLDKVVSGGGWKSPHIALRYAKRAGIANEGVQISEE